MNELRTVSRQVDLGELIHYVEGHGPSRESLLHAIARAQGRISDAGLRELLALVASGSDATERLYYLLERGHRALDWYAPHECCEQMCPCSTIRTYGPAGCPILCQACQDRLAGQVTEILDQAAAVIADWVHPWR